MTIPDRTETKRIMPLVRSVLKEFPEARDNYKVLFIKVWERCGLDLSDEQREVFLKETPAILSIDRAARKIWEEKQYLPSETIRKNRQLLEEDHRKEMVKQAVFVGNIAYIE